eukprot:CAMPEP_0168330210 /NCGR_PEP_ID=MMETSP0213-20121227/7580_1 /TAXON_ID=151035 /ORGANISM="Euplotes harpa, Strain FSP1.4" /LENGTH=180 /DNA_ID=CAMNT_0008333707 /DNA_START=263 /DNA_END=805 /DNA_ORIENTATION=-
MKEIKELFKDEYLIRQKQMWKIKQEENKMLKLNIKYGNTCKENYPGVKNLTEKQQKNEFKWTAYVDLGLSRQETEKLIRNVVFKLHPTFRNPTRTITKFPFQLTTTGWGTFEMPMIINWKDNTKMEPLRLTHTISFDDRGAENKYALKIKKELISEPKVAPLKSNTKKANRATSQRPAFR